MSNTEIRIQYTPTSSDFIRILIWYRWKRTAITLGVVLIFLWFFTFYLAAVKTNIQDSGVVPTLLLTTIILPLALATITYLSIRRQAKKIEATAQPTEVVFEEDGIKTITPNSSTEARWERYEKVCETKSDFIFFPQHNIFFGVPKRYFSNDREVERLREILKQRMGRKATLRA
ncbi:MAG TPA: YcxB family protein [Pyrinomonadaceae bacterium]|nr:YcxB family protein [Pyrinomonadaceae bacterium]